MMFDKIYREMMCDGICGEMMYGEISDDWSDVPNDVLPGIMRHLEVVDFIRFSAISDSCRSASLIRNCRPKKDQIPWLMLPSPGQPEFRFFQSLTDRKTYKFCLPQIAGHHAIGSSEGFLITVDRFAQIHALNPLTGEEGPFPLPPTVTQPGFVEVRRDSEGKITHYVEEYCLRDGSIERQQYDVLNMRSFYRKAIVSPSLDTMVVIQGGSSEELAFARAGDTSWTLLKPSILMFRFIRDIIFHNGRLHAIDVAGGLFVFDPDNYLVPPVDLASNTYPFFLHDEDGNFPRFLVVSPDGNDFFFLVKILDDANIPPITKTFRVAKLNKKNSSWTEVRDIGDVAIFVGFNHSIAYSTHDFSPLKKNSIYFTYDDRVTHNPYRASGTPSYKEDGEYGIFNLEDGSIQLFTPNEFKRNWPSPVWFNPVYGNYLK